MNILSYDTCHHNIMEETIHMYKRKILKDRGNNIVTDRKQALAIGLSEGHRKCKRNKEEIKKLLNKVNKDLNNTKELNLTDVIETHDMILLLKKMNKINVVNKFKELLWKKIIKENIDNNKINKNIWIEIKKIYY